MCRCPVEVGQKAPKTTTNHKPITFNFLTKTESFKLLFLFLIHIMQPHLGLEKNYQSRIPFIRFYFNRLINTAIKLANPKKSELILDFGCGNQYLNKKLPGYKIIGYDIVPEMSDIKDYTKVKPDLIFASMVFEHMPAEELNKTLKNFIKMSNARLLTVTPKENIIARLLVKLIPSIKPSWKDHKLKYKQVHRIIKKYYILKKQKTVLTEAKVALWIKK